MSDAIFLSAGVPDPKRGPEFAKTADTVAITAAVCALVHVTLGRRLLVWGGQPAITPMIWVVAEGLGLQYGSWVKLYQSRYFKDEFPEDNVRFQNVTFIDDVERDREKSLRARYRPEGRFSHWQNGCRSSIAICAMTSTMLRYFIGI
jgi:SLOG cluster3 family